ncbi:hypothetical protein DD630_25925 [Streptomyces sp. BSE7F]|nr:hypothetical protein DD630_25925 [Streptomyces sp. BSE7F]
MGPTAIREERLGRRIGRTGPVEPGGPGRRIGRTGPVEPGGPGRRIGRAGPTEPGGPGRWNRTGRAERDRSGDRGSARPLT